MLIKISRRPTSSALLLTKLISFFTIINCAIIFIEFIGFEEKVNSDYSKTYHVELSKNPDEPLSSAIKPGAVTKYLAMKDFLHFKEDDTSKERIDYTDVFLSVRTTNQYHVTRLKILLDTWISLHPASTWIFTDNDDPWLKGYVKQHYQRNMPALIETHCPTSTENKYALACKMYWEYRTFLSSGRDWFCHFDDDTYVNVNMLLLVLNRLSKYKQIYLGKSPSRKPVTVMSYDTVLEEPEILNINGTNNETIIWSIPEITYRRVSFHYAMGGAGFCISKQLAIDMKSFAIGSQFIKTVASIAMPDDCVTGFIITHLLNVSLISADFFHSHLEDMQAIDEDDLPNQVTISYDLPDNGYGDNMENSVFFHGHLSNTTVRDKSTNVINIKGIFTSEIDPTRFYSFHYRLRGSLERRPAGRQVKSLTPLN